MNEKELRAGLKKLAEEFPGWHCYAPGVNGLLFAHFSGSVPRLQVSGESLEDLRDSVIRANSEHAEQIYRDTVANSGAYGALVRANPRYAEL